MKTTSLFLSSLLICTVLYCCQISTKQSVAEHLNGEELSKKYCISCHLYSSPNLLDKKTWNQYVLVRMAAYMGIYTNNTSYFEKMPDQWLEPGVGGERVRAAKIYPDKPVLTRAEWEEIRQYYLATAPDKLEGNTEKYESGLPFFEARSLSARKLTAPLIQAIEIDYLSEKIYVSEYREDISCYNYEGRFLSKKKLQGDFVDLKASGDLLYALDMGTRIASDNPTGQLMTLDLSQELAKAKTGIMLDKLMRPVNFEVFDFNKDKKDDFVISEYGNQLGALNLYISKESGEYEKITLMEDDGYIRSSISDLDGDGDVDILALQGNSNEGIDAFINQGKQSFERRRKLDFLPTNGSTHFSLVDFDKDGNQDILYSNGDNGDYEPLMKPYHGIHLFQNENGSYKEKFFIPQNGVYQSEAVDFDLDGDMDIIAVSYHPDFSKGAKDAFVLHLNDGQNNFSSYSLKEVNQSRWMRFAVVDVDADGDQDILLTAMNIKTPEDPKAVSEKWERTDEAILVLENKTR